MKNFILTLTLSLISLCLALPVLAAQPKAEVFMTCSGFQGENGQAPVGMAHPTLVKLKGQGDTLFVRTMAIFNPNAKPRFEELVPVGRQIETAQYESESFEVEMFHHRGLRATIKRKGSELSASCSNND
ncbi:MAG TPA: hypothetical protein VIH99_02005 [Bdellovibrionota bacterium]